MNAATRSVLPGLFALIACSVAGADTLPVTAEADGPVLPFGQPPRWRLGIGPLLGYDSSIDAATGRLFLDAEGRVAMPQFGLLDVHLEGALDFDPDGVGSAIGAYAKLPYIRVGVERDFDDHRFDVTLSMQGSVRRGGMFHHGERLRIDYTPARQRVQVGFVFNTPWMRYRTTRPYHINAQLPKGALPAPLAADASRVDAGEIDRIAHAIEWIDRSLTPNLVPYGYYTTKGKDAFDAALDELAAHQGQAGHDFAGEDSSYHANLDLAFTRAAGGDATLGRALAQDAERTIFDEIVVPFDRLFGRPRRAKGLDGLGKIAQARFDEIVSERMGADEAAAAATREVFRRTVRCIDTAARASRTRWEQTLSWLPLNYGLRPAQYDSQAEIEDVVGRIEGATFSRANTVRYILNDQFYYQLRRMIRETREYHVLWVHDFRGLNDRKAPDRVAWSQATEGYIEAFTEAVHAMDRGERTDLPLFFVFLDEHYYEVNESRQLVTLLDHLDRARVPKLDDPALAERLESAVGRLREAVRLSPALAARGDEYLRRRLRVQVQITYPLDPSYAGDILMRDHRKLAFRDVSESAPTAGCGIFTGEGVGEKYAGPYWEDRSLLVRGEGLVRLKTAARSLLLSQGFRAEEVPLCLRAGPIGEHRATLDSLERKGWSDDLLVTMNETGWGPKHSTILKATLYNLMPRGALLIAPDSIWTSDFWACMFVSAAMRGCLLYVIAPAGAHAPSNALPTLGLMHETLSALFRAKERLAPFLARVGGELNVGLYTRESDVSDMRALLEGLLEPHGPSVSASAGIRFHPEVLRALRAEHDTLKTAYPGPAHPPIHEEEGKPQIHMKAQFFASKEALGILARPEWGPILSRYLAVRRRQTATPESCLEDLAPALFVEGSNADGVPAHILSAHRDSVHAVDPAAAERIFYLATVGSHNQDRRSMLFDGETLVALGGPGALLTAIDFATLIRTATWPATAAELDAQFPSSSRLTMTLRRKLRNQI